VNILEAMDDPELFGPHFQGRSWNRWRAFLAALFALPLSEPDLALYRHHTGGCTAPTAPFSEATLICGRRSGKSRVLALLGVYLACFTDYSERLASGERGTVCIIAADRRQARGILRYVVGMLRSIPLLAPLIESEIQVSVTLTNGIVIEIHTASFRVTRGYSLVAALCDEVAFWRDEDSANPDLEILAALRPGLANLGGLLLLASSPYSMRGALYRAYRDHYGRDHARVLVWRGTSLEMNPSLPAHVVADAYEADPVFAAAEYGAEFRNDIASFVSREVVDSATVPGRFELPPISTVSYSAFVDPSGGSADSMTLAIAHRRGELGVLDAVREIRPPFSPESVVIEFAALLKAYGVRTVTGDRYGGEWPRERFREHGVTYEVAEKPKGEIYRDMLPLLNSSRLELLDHPRLSAQLWGLERRIARGGRDSIDHPPGGHDDIANSAAGALLAVAGKRSAVAIFEALAP
jgi:hypothetical protein